MTNCDIVVCLFVHEKKEEFKRLLESLNANSNFNKYQVVVINNARDPLKSKEISKLSRDYLAGRFLEVNRVNWPSLKEEIKEGMERGLAGQLNGLSLNLGNEGWAIHHARNIANLIVLKFFPQAKHMISFDSDIMIPADLTLENEAFENLTCFQIAGSPDFARIEWLELFLMATYSATSSMDVGEYLKNIDSYNYMRKGYAYRMSNSLELSQLKYILNHYSNLEFSYGIMADDEPDFNLREENHGACSIISTNVLHKCMYPEWCENDWVVFKAIRGRGVPPSFLDKFVVHHSIKKDVLNSEMLIQEEIGKMSNVLLFSQADLSEKSAQNTINMRIAAVERLLRAFERLESNDQIQITKITQVLETLIDAMKQIDLCNDICRPVSSFCRQRLIWDDIVFHLKNSICSK